MLDKAGRRRSLSLKLALSDKPLQRWSWIWNRSPISLPGEWSFYFFEPGWGKQVFHVGGWLPRLSTRRVLTENFRPLSKPLRALLPIPRARPGAPAFWIYEKSEAEERGARSKKPGRFLCCIFCLTNQLYNNIVKQRFSCKTNYLQILWWSHVSLNRSRHRLYSGAPPAAI